MNRVTIKDIAQKAGVSYSTVSRALSGSPQVSEKKRQEILKICKEMHYTTNTVARAMVKKSTQLLGLIVTDISNPFMSELAYHIDCEATAHGYSTIVSNSLRDLDREETIFKDMLSHQVDGMILCPASPESYERLSYLLEMVPTVFFGENLRELPVSYVSIDNRRGAALGVEYLYDLGHRDILYFGRRSGSETHRMRALGYEDACRKFGLTPAYLDNPEKETSIQNGYHLALDLFSRERTYTAVFASTDTNALGVMKAAQEMGIRIPEDLSLLGFDNIRDASLPRIELTTVEQPLPEMASAAVESLMDRFLNEQEGYTHRVFYPSIVRRSSCAAGPKRPQ